MRNYKLYLQDMLEAVQKIEKYTKGMNFQQFEKSDLVIDGVIRNLEVIGEASKQVPADVKKEFKDIEWKKISGLRDILIHAYFGVDIQIIWDVTQNNVPLLKKNLQTYLRK